MVFLWYIRNESIQKNSDVSNIVLIICIFVMMCCLIAADDLISLVQLVLNNAAIAAESEDLVAAGHLWGKMAEAPGRWEGKEWGLLALAAADNVALCLESYADHIAE